MEAVWARSTIRFLGSPLRAARGHSRVESRLGTDRIDFGERRPHLGGGRQIAAGTLDGLHCGLDQIDVAKPATFTHPVYSLMADWVMFKDMLTGRIGF